MKLNNLKITPKLGILVGVTLLGLCAAGILAGYLMQREMLTARIDQIHSMVDMARNMAAGCRSRSMPASSPRKPRSPSSASAPTRMTYDNGAGYLFGRPWTASPCWRGSEAARQNRMDVMTNGRLSAELRDGVAAKGDDILLYEYVKPAAKQPIRKVAYAVARSRLEHVCRHRRLSRRSRCQDGADRVGARACHPRHRA